MSQSPDRTSRSCIGIDGSLGLLRSLRLAQTLAWRPPLRSLAAPGGAELLARLAACAEARADARLAHSAALARCSGLRREPLASLVRTRRELVGGCSDQSRSSSVQPAALRPAPQSTWVPVGFSLAASGQDVHSSVAHGGGAHIGATPCAAVDPGGTQPGTRRGAEHPPSGSANGNPGGTQPGTRQGAEHPPAGGRQREPHWHPSRLRA